MNKKNQNPSMFWMVWAGLIGNVLYMQFMIDGGLPSGEDQGESPTWIFVVSISVVVIATFIRWFLIPKAESVGKVFVLFVIGMAISEVVALYGVFLLGPELPETKLFYFILSVVSMTQFVPVFASKFKA